MGVLTFFKTAVEPGVVIPASTVQVFDLNSGGLLVEVPLVAGMPVNASVPNGRRVGFREVYAEGDLAASDWACAGALSATPVSGRFEFAAAVSGDGLVSLHAHVPREGVQRWQLRSVSDPASFTTVFVNPSEMSSPYPTRQVGFESTTAADGNTLVWEGPMAPKDWQFSGVCLSHSHFKQLRDWVYAVPGKVVIRDHFGRDIVAVLREFDAIPQPRTSLDPRRYWRHSYTISGLVLSVSEGTVGL